MERSQCALTRAKYGSFVFASVMAAALFASTAAAAPRVSTRQVLQAPAPTAGDRFGTKTSISQDGSTIVVGSAGANASAGAVDVYVHDGAAWIHQATLTPSDPVAGDGFGSALAVAADGSTLAIGAPFKSVLGRKASGAFYVFDRTGTTWTQTAELTPTFLSPQNHFGASLSIAAIGTEVAVGAPGRNWADLKRAGTAYVYQRVKKVWKQTATVPPPNPVQDGRFGLSVIVKEDLVLVAEPGDSNGGIVSIFDRAGGSYVHTTDFEPPDLEPGDNFGAAMALTQATVVVGAPNHATEAGGEGAAYRFTHNDTTGVWTYRNELTAANGAPGDEFGSAISLASGTLVIGAPGRNAGTAFAFGAVYPYHAAGASWTPAAEIDAPHDPGSRHTGFASTVGASGATVVAGESKHAVGGAASAGVADVFTDG
jgi:hypothetical protein